jgi:pantoate--beta-alanine ligase
VIELATLAAMRSWSRATRGSGRRIAFVPTMGFLHEGHLRLVDRARRVADTVVMSIFVNPTQFGPNEDFAKYPRDLDRDRALADGRRVDCLFVPTTEAMYPMPAVLRIDPGPLAAHLCGPRRPGHFAGVLTVVAKLFNIVDPDVAIFGRKDVQQARVIRRMASELDMRVAIDVAPTVREPDGLALSSRNVYLDAQGRKAAPALARGLDAAAAAYRGGTTDPGALVEAVMQVIRPEKLIVPEYVELVDPEALAPVTTAADDSILALAARIGGTRLIDNVILGRGTADDRSSPPVPLSADAARGNAL